jgi:hypothetical protein
MSSPLPRCWIRPSSTSWRPLVWPSPSRMSSNACMRPMAETASPVCS